ncbi:MAG: BclA C-terminal domain-containing protein [Nitrospirota bacterium]
MKPQTLTHILTAVVALGVGLTAQTSVASPDRGSPGGNTTEQTSAVPAAPDVNPPPDGGYPGFTTAEGLNALKNLTSGVGNSAFGWYSLFSNTTASYNTGLGAGTLALNTGAANTASGVASLILNTEGTRNTSNGAGAMVWNSTGNDNSGIGYFSLYNNDTGNSNSALGSDTLLSNVSGNCNVAVGESALIMNTTGDDNIAVGCGAGSEATTGSNNIYIGNIGVAGESDTIRIGDPAIHHKAFIAGIPAGGLAAILFDYNNGTIVVGVGGAVSFNQAPLIVGTAISKTNDTTFTVNADGVYRVSYTLRTALISLLGGVQVHVNGSGVGPTAGLVIAGVPLSDQVTFQANAGDTLQLVVSGLALTLAAGDNATINIDKIQ